MNQGSSDVYSAVEFERMDSITEPAFKIVSKIPPSECTFFFYTGTAENRFTDKPPAKRTGLFILHGAEGINTHITDSRAVGALHPPQEMDRRYRKLF
jgi:hypothetical protein